MAARKTSPGKSRRRARVPAVPDNALEIAAFSLGAIAVATVGLFFFRRVTAPREGHAAPDLARDTHPGFTDRAPPAFRPDMDAPMTAAEREALRPATGPGPTLTRGEGFLPGGIGS